MPPFALVPAYLSQLPTSRSVAVVIMAGLGPPLFSIQMTMLGISLMNGIPGADLFSFASLAFQNGYVCILTG
jgi:hypothetical protein